MTTPRPVTTPGPPGVCRWALVSATAAPLALIGGWTWAASRQPGHFDPVRNTISALAAHDATDRWIMTAGLVVLGVGHVVTAAGLPGAGPPARAVLALGGVATVAVAALPQPSAGHVPAATVGFVALTLWPALSRRPSRRVARSAALVLLVLLVWLGFELRNGALLGLSERLLAGAQALWPLAVVVAVLGRPAAADQSGRRRI